MIRSISIFLMFMYICSSMAEEQPPATVNWKTEEPKESTRKFVEKVEKVISGIKDTQIMCLPILSGSYKITNGDNLDLAVDIGHVRGEKLKSIRQMALYNREDKKLYNVAYIEYMDIVGDFNMKGKLFGEDLSQGVTGTVRKQMETFYIQFSQTAEETEDGMLKITGFETSTYAVFKLNIDWGIDNEELNKFSNEQEQGYPYTSGIQFYNEAFKANIGEGYIIDVSTMFDNLIKEGAAAAECP